MSQRIVTLLLPGYTSNSLLHHEPSQGDIMPRASSPASNPAYRFSEDLDRQPWQSQLASALGLDTEGGMRLPSAVLAVGKALDTGGSLDSTGLVCADPIGLKADRDSATLIAPEQLGLSENEADELLEALNDFLAEDGYVFFRQGAAQWFMSGLNADALATYPPSFLANRKASTFLPEGDEAAPWRRLMTEIQMLLHTHPVNVLRESRGLMPVNSVWFWGGAPLPDDVPAKCGIELYTDCEQAKALAAYAGVTTRALDEIKGTMQNVPLERDVVIVDTATVDAWLAGDAGRLEERLAFVEEQWLEPLSCLVADKHLEEVRVLTEDGLQGTCNLQTMAQVLSANSSGVLSRLRAFFKI